MICAKLKVLFPTYIVSRSTLHNAGGASWHHDRPGRRSNILIKSATKSGVQAVSTNSNRCAKNWNIEGGDLIISMDTEYTVSYLFILFIQNILTVKFAVNPLNTKLNPICYLMALLGAHHFLHVRRIRVKLLTFRRLMSYIYGKPILDVSRSHTTTQYSR